MAVGFIISSLQEAASQGSGNPSRPVTRQTAMAPLSFMKVFLPSYPIYLSVFEARCYGKSFEGILVGIKMTAILVAPFGALFFLKAMLISPHTYVLGEVGMKKFGK